MKRAVLVGIDRYDERTSLSGCCNDVTALGRRLSSHEDGLLNFECRTYCAGAERITRLRLSELVDQALDPGAEAALFYFAGHADSSDSDVLLAGQESHTELDGLAVSEILARARRSTLGEIILILDCCHAGAAGRVPQLGGDAALLRSGVSVLSACRADQRACEDESRRRSRSSRGLFSTHLCDALDGGAADVLGKVDVAGVYAYVSECFGAFDQRPTFLTNAIRPAKLRRCLPAVSLTDLRRLPRIFESADAHLPLSPAHEPTVEPSDPAKEEEFRMLQEYRAARLLSPVGADHMYGAAVDGRSCRLTALGRHYWRMAAAARL